MRVSLAIGVLGLSIHGSSTALPGTPDASAAVTNARPGFVRHVSGNPAVLGAGHPQSEPLQAGRWLKSGEQVITRAGDRVEIVLSADSYLRLGGQARVEVLSNEFPAMDLDWWRERPWSIPREPGGSTMFRPFLPREET